MVEDGDDDSGVPDELTDALQCRNSLGRSLQSPSNDCFEGEGDIDMKLSRAKLNRPRSESLKLIDGVLDGLPSRSGVFGTGSSSPHRDRDTLSSSSVRSNSGVCVILGVNIRPNGCAACAYRVPIPRSVKRDFRGRALCRHKEWCKGQVYARQRARARPCQVRRGQPVRDVLALGDTRVLQARLYRRSQPQSQDAAKQGRTRLGRLAGGEGRGSTKRMCCSAGEDISVNEDVGMEVSSRALRTIPRTYPLSEPASLPVTLSRIEWRAMPLLVIVGCAWLTVLIAVCLSGEAKCAVVHSCPIGCADATS